MLLLGAAGVRAVKHLSPVFCPGLAPGHGAAADRARFAGQSLLVAFEVVIHDLIMSRIGIQPWLTRFSRVVIRYIFNSCLYPWLLRKLAIY